MSLDLSLWEYTQAPDTMPFLDFGGLARSPADISTLIEALSFVEDRLKENPRNVARLWQVPNGYTLIYGDGITRTVRVPFITSSTTTELASKK